MSPVRVIIAATISALVGAACAAQERVGRAPSAAAIQRIDAAAETYGEPLVLEYVDPVPGCAGGGCGQASQKPGPLDPVKIQRIVSASAEQMTVVTDAGETRGIGLPSVKAVRAPDGNNSLTRSILIGTAAGVGFAGLEIGGLYLLAQALQSDPGSPSSPGSYRPVITLAIVSVLVGAVVGAVAGPSRPHRVYVLENEDRAPEGSILMRNAGNGQAAGGGPKGSP
jgi:hypothetical protein